MKKAVILVPLLMVLFASSYASPIQARKKDHPGCAIWWFFPGCPLAKLFGADPFNIYPWEKFCKRYSSIETHEVCQDFKIKEKASIPVVLLKHKETENESRSEIDDLIRGPKVSFKRSERRVQMRQNLCEGLAKAFPVFCEDK